MIQLYSGATRDDVRDRGFVLTSDCAESEDAIRLN
jgi:hypothetical protein